MIATTEHWIPAIPVESRGTGKSLRVLIVDHDPASRLLCSINLRIDGLVVLEASDGLRGLEQAREQHPDLIVTGVRMPGLNGFKLAEALRFDVQTRQIPLIFVSAETTPGYAARAHELGALAYLVKPLKPSVLSSLVASIAARRGSRRQHLGNDIRRNASTAAALGGFGGRLLRQQLPSDLGCESLRGA